MLTNITSKPKTDEKHEKECRLIGILDRCLKSIECSKKLRGGFATEERYRKIMKDTIVQLKRLDYYPQDQRLQDVVAGYESIAMEGAR